MTLTPEQKNSVSLWVAAGDNLSAVQKKITEQFKVSMTYRDVRFLVDDLNLELKDPAPKVDASDVSKTPPPVAKAPSPSAQHAGTADAATESPADLAADGAQAVAAMAFGTKTIPRADKIIGPGNQYVAEAKRQVFGYCDIDMIAGPTELAVIANEHSDPQFVAADLMASLFARVSAAVY